MPIMNVITILCDTFRRDHCGAYNQGRPLDEVGGPDQPHWVVSTPHLDRLASRGTVFDQARLGSSPCMPARRDLYTGKYEFLRRGWAPLEDDDPDLPRQLSPRPTKSISQYGPGDHVSYLVSDHVCLWTNGSGNYHMNYSGFDFIRGNQEDPWTTDLVELDAPEPDKADKMERYFRNKVFYGKQADRAPVARVMTRASEWLRGNYQHDGFYLHIDSYDPHEPWDPPVEMVRKFDPQGYDVPGWTSHPPYTSWRGRMTEDQFNSYRARYAAKVEFVDQWLGKLFDTMDELDLWRNTMVVFMTDHGTFNGDHGRIGKGQTHEFSGKSHLPFIVYHPEFGHGERRDQLVQAVDVYATVLDVFGKPMPADRDGVSLIPVLKDPGAPTREVALTGQFGHSISMTDGTWTLHQGTDPSSPLYWYSYHLSRFYSDMALGPFVDGRRRVLTVSPALTDAYQTTWLTKEDDDPGELVNLAERYPDKVREMQHRLVRRLRECGAPAELPTRFGLGGLGPDA
jgi:arylsulfatase A-like enzyme